MFNCTENRGNKLSTEIDGKESILTISSKEFGCDLVVCLSEKDSIKLKDQLQDRPRFLLNRIKVGSKLTFNIAAPGTVKEVWETASYAGTDNVSRMRLFVVHENGHESYHTYRADGRSQVEYTHDILSVDNA